MIRPHHVDEDDMAAEEIEFMLIEDEAMRRYEQLPPPPEVIQGVSFNGQPLEVDMCDDLARNPSWSGK